jgi:prephenate dehydrogenase
MHSAVVVGTGLIGTSIALALRERVVSTYLLDADESAARTAEANGAGLAERPPGRADIAVLAVLAVPPAQVAVALADAQKGGIACSYTDVASVRTGA